MKIAFFTENNFYGKLTRTQGGRTDSNWLIALDATNIYFGFEPKEIYDLGIIIVPKKNPNRAVDFFHKHRTSCKRWSVMQEGPSNYFQDFSIEDQFQYLLMLNEMDLILCHNEIDRLYFKGLFHKHKVEILPSLLIEDSVPKIPYEKRLHSIISGNMCSWYGGMDSFIVGQNLSEIVYVPSMGRKREGEEHIQNLVHLPYMNWQDWFLELNKRRYGVNLMRTFAAGSFSLACARLKIPCIGWKGLDTQEKLFPELTFPVGNMIKATDIAGHLRENEQFYQHCAEYAFKKYTELYSEEAFLTNIKEILHEN